MKLPGIKKNLFANAYALFFITNNPFHGVEIMTMNREQGIEALTKIDETSRKLQRQGLDREALDCMQLGLLKRRELFGPKSKELASACRIVGEALNSIALKNVDASNFSDAVEYLKQALKLMQNDDFGRHETYLNFAALHQKKGQPRVVLRYLRQVLTIQSQLCFSDDIRANVHLNVCATLSRLGKHESALRHAKIAIKILENLIQESPPRNQSDNQDQHRSVDSGPRRMLLDMEAIDENASGVHSIEENLLMNIDAKIILKIASKTAKVSILDGNGCLTRQKAQVKRKGTSLEITLPKDSLYTLIH